ncbi:hypothetical protein JR316_0012751 [Psilocybe cubensis]|uniref:Uncharacterized protein n=1 Tax=Psilocybe cubensis TaxID=181762 RepID=A0ACB8GJF6_PSICU|nr:hypothetical protein JR316_0012751 [Psilocybe cubensis]KAH9475634.1 hypothetical protein JR316_0012751 [Psilocybe cubensis]
MSKNKSVGSTFDRLPCATSTRDTLFIRDLSNLTINIDRFVIVDNKGVRRITDWVVSPQKKAECSALQTILPAIFSHIKQIVNLRHRALAIKIEKKRSTAATADVEMADATKPGPSIQSLIDKGLNARLKKLNLGSTLSGQNSSKAPQPQAKKAGPSKFKPSSTPSQKKPQTKASNKVDNKKKGKGRAPVKNDPKGKGKARA